mgnify:CR=1 FL=1
MKPERYKKNDVIIRYGDEGTHFYILVKGNVKVLVYKPQTDPKDPELDKKIIISKIME